METFSSRWGWLVGLILSPVLAYAIGDLAQVRLTDLTVAIIVGIAVLYWVGALAILVLKLERPIVASMSTQGRKCSVLEDIRSARARFMEEILGVAKQMPVLDEEGLDKIDALVQSAGFSKRLADGLGEARNLAATYALALIVSLPATAVVAVIIGRFPDTGSSELFGGFLAVLVGYIAFLMVLEDTQRAVFWGQKVMVLSGENLDGVTRQIRNWADEARR